jgi:hypothetical protein
MNNQDKLTLDDLVGFAALVAFVFLLILGAAWTETL